MCGKPRHAHNIRKYGRPSADVLCIRVFLAAQTARPTGAAFYLNGNNMLHFQTVAVELCDFLCYDFPVALLRIALKA